MDLKKYIMDVEQLEKEKYALECIINKIDRKISELYKPYTVYRRGNPIKEDDMKLSSTQIGLIIAGIILFIIGVNIFSENADFDYAFTSILIFCALIFWVPAILMIGGVYFCIKSNKEEYEKNEKKIASEYQAQLQNAKKQEQHNKAVAAYYQQARNNLYITYEKTCNLLSQMYSIGIIAEEYRWDIVAICTFSQYLRSRKCFTLEGHEGAYLLYEEEKFRKIVIGKLDEIIERLDRIEQNQYGIAMALREINNTQNKILNNLEGIAQRQEQQLENAEYMRYDLEVLKTNSNIAMIYGMRYI